MLKHQSSQSCLTFCSVYVDLLLVWVAGLVKSLGSKKNTTQDEASIWERHSTLLLLLLLLPLLIGPS